MALTLQHSMLNNIYEGLFKHLAEHPYMNTAENVGVYADSLCVAVEAILTGSKGMDSSLQIAMKDFVLNAIGTMNDVIIDSAANNYKLSMDVIVEGTAITLAKKYEEKQYEAFDMRPLMVVIDQIADGRIQGIKVNDDDVARESRGSSSMSVDSDRRMSVDSDRRMSVDGTGIDQEALEAVKRAISKMSLGM